MSLPVLGALVVLGIGGVVALVHLLGLSSSGRFPDEAAVRETLLRDDPDAVIGEVILADDGAAAVISTRAGAAVAARLGDRRFVRSLGAGALRSLRERGDALVVTLDDFSAPALRLRLSDPARRMAAKALLERAT